eukprot:981299-Pelagomonas_calceolata.AAC.4
MKVHHHESTAWRKRTDERGLRSPCLAACLKQRSPHNHRASPQATPPTRVTYNHRAPHKQRHQPGSPHNHRAPPQATPDALVLSPIK